MPTYFFFGWDAALPAGLKGVVECGLELNWNVTPTYQLCEQPPEVAWR